MSLRYPLTTARRAVPGLFFVCALALGGTSQVSHADPKTQQNSALGAGQKIQDAVTGVAELGKMAPGFLLVDTDGKSHKLSDYKGKVVVLEWFNPDCPFVKKHHKNSRSMNAAYRAVEGKDVVWLAINSGAPGKQGAGLDRNKQAKEEYGITYPILLDPTGIVGRAYGAKNTPHMFVIDAAGKLAYNGAIDNDPSPDVLGDENYVVDTVHRLQKGETVQTSQTKPYGCSVKYAS